MKIGNLLVAAALLPLSALAQELDYTFVELSYSSSELDAGPADVDGNGLTLAGSLALTENVFGFASYASEDYDFGIDGSRYDIGAGMRWGLRQDVDVIAEAAWVHVEYDIGPASADDNGLGLGVGLRGRVHDDIELQGKIRYVDLDDSDTFLSLGGRYYFSDSVAAGLGLDLGDDASSWTLGIRAEFGN